MVAAGIEPGDPQLCRLLPATLPTRKPVLAVLNAFELMKAMIEAGAAAVRFGRSAGHHEEMRSHGRQSFGANSGSYSDNWSRRVWQLT